MDYADIGRRTSPETARKIKSDIFDSLFAAGQQAVEGDQLDALTRGAVILGIEPVDAPLTDGLFVYLKRPAGDVMALLIETDVNEQDGGSYEVLRISKGMIA